MIDVDGVPARQLNLKLVLTVILLLAGAMTASLPARAQQKTGIPALRATTL